MSDKQGLIVLDWDHTLFNTTTFVETQREAFLAKGISYELFNQKRQGIKDCCNVIDIDQFANSFDQIDATTAHSIINTILREKAESFIFSDVKPFLKKHKTLFDFLVITHGNSELQSEKMKYSHLEGLQSVITEGSKAEAVKPYVDNYAKIYYIDDKAEHIDDVKKMFPQIIALFLQRPDDSPYANIPSKCKHADRVIKNLDLTLSLEVSS